MFKVQGHFMPEMLYVSYTTLLKRGFLSKTPKKNTYLSKASTVNCSSLEFLCLAMISSYSLPFEGYHQYKNKQK